MHHTSVVVCTFISPSKHIPTNTCAHKCSDHYNEDVGENSFILDLLQFAYQLSAGVNDAKALLK